MNYLIVLTLLSLLSFPVLGSYGQKDEIACGEIIELDRLEGTKTKSEEEIEISSSSIMSN